MSYARIVYIAQIIVMLITVLLLTRLLLTDAKIIETSEEGFGFIVGMSVLLPLMAMSLGLSLLILIGLFIGPRRLRLRLALWLVIVGIGWGLFEFAGPPGPKIIVAQEVIGLSFAAVCLVLPIRWLLRPRGRRRNERSVAISMRR